ncbi:MAG: (2Fe-2S)-binding protein [Polyangiales bacterium]|jgi:isoquinoline 1-oxidoreductase alpha subunit
MSPISFTLNERAVRLEVDTSRKLIWVLRTELAMTGTKPSCARGLCGACTVLVDDRPVRSCITPVESVRGKRVVTIEALAKDGELHPLQEAFIRHDALQCGFCTPGMILTAYGLLRDKRKRSRREIARAMDGNLCRCGAHTRILDAIESAAAEMK